jgi:Protein of unknown function (DUF3176)
MVKHGVSIDETAEPVQKRSRCDFKAVESAAHRSEVDKLSPRLVESPLAPPWQPGVLRRLPWTSFIALLGALGCVAAAGLILLFSNGRSKLDWQAAPAVWLAVLTAVGNALIRYAQAEGVNISWWTRSLRGAPIATLHRDWAFGTSLWTSLTAGRNFLSIMVFGNIFTTLCLVDGPLLQRATSIVSRSIEETVQLNVSLATDAGNFSSIPGVVGSLSSEFVQVLSDYADGRPIQASVSGCYGNCTGKVRTLGLNGSCLVTSTEPTDWAKDSVSADDWNVEATLLNVTFPFLFFWTMQEDQRRLLDFDVSYFTPAPGTPPTIPMEIGQPLSTCPGFVTRKSCSYNIGIAEYPISVINQTLTLSSNESTFPVVSMDSFLRSNPGDLMSNGYYNLTRAYGFNDAARWLFSSTITITPLVLSSSDFGPTSFNWKTDFKGPLAVQNLAVTQISSCNRTIQDPTDYILRSMSEILFRVGVAAAQMDPRPMQAFEAKQVRIDLIYTSNLRFFAAAACIMLCAIMLVAGTHHRWWLIGRPVSLSPLEIAKAFDAPLLAVPGTSNTDVKALLDVVGEMQVKYGGVLGSDTARLRREVGGSESGVKKLCIAESNEVHKPVAGERFT